MKLNDIVVTNHGGDFGVVKEIFPYGGGTLAHLHYIDLNTGKLRKCPDSRCKGEHTCPIHGTNQTYARSLSDHDLDFFVKEGMISKKLAEACKEARGGKIVV